ncbi:hypothetical protein CABS03_11725 [Colletotrichum abscissum]|uniref:Uncharacterized protein n=2 Tax=Colletotrichum acutatum species complex TaxID=2707335 RepID=A0A9P9X9P6_9PEZI|nr:hypothetical protein CABS02_09916 [Colletotrichum abscissum]KAK0367906.1 hypothetical protein CLIM01_14737 [Colletotrichum limetticola]
MGIITGSIWGERRRAAATSQAAKSQASEGVRACHIAVSALKDGPPPIRPQPNLATTN